MQIIIAFDDTDTIIRNWNTHFRTKYCDVCLIQKNSIETYWV